MEVVAANVSQITKFYFLKELWEPQVRSSIDSLPFTTEGYKRAKNILKMRFGNESKIVNAYVSKIMSLPMTYRANPNKVWEFYEILCMNGLAHGYVKMTLNKLEGIRRDLVRTEDECQEWKFEQPVKALRKWTVRNPPKPNEDLNYKKPPS